jgi:hypothetical protein
MVILFWLPFTSVTMSLLVFFFQRSSTMSALTHEAAIVDPWNSAAVYSSSLKLMMRKVTTPHLGFKGTIHKSCNSKIPPPSRHISI